MICLYILYESQTIVEYIIIIYQSEYTRSANPVTGSADHDEKNGQHKTAETSRREQPALSA